VVDTVERLVIESFGYQTLDQVDDDVLLLEWDIAIDREGLEQFVEHIHDEPNRVLVAPYRLYYPDLPEPVWAHRLWNGEPVGELHPAGCTFVSEDDRSCNLFGLGMTYLPKQIIRGAIEARPANRLGDTELSMWHYRHVAKEVPICWDVRPIHLHYAIEGLVT
jgi:hypothetical protein